MKSKNKHSLWVNLAVYDYFLVPNNLNLPDGNCAIRNLMGIEKQIDPDAIAPYKISAKEAEPYMQQEVTQSMEQISSLFSNVVAIALQNNKGNSRDAAKSADPTQ